MKKLLCALLTALVLTGMLAAPVLAAPAAGPEENVGYYDIELEITPFASGYVTNTVGILNAVNGDGAISSMKITAPSSSAKITNVTLTGLVSVGSAGPVYWHLSKGNIFSGYAVAPVQSGGTASFDDWNGETASDTFYIYITNAPGTISNPTYATVTNITMRVYYTY